MSKRVLEALLFATMFLASPALAQARGPGGRGGGPGQRMFDPATVTTVSGTVSAVERLARGRHDGVHLTLTTSDGFISVHLGPDSYLDRQPVQVAKGDRIEVTGSKVMVQGKPALIAQTVKKGDAVLTLRDAAGVPAWAGQGRGSR